MTDSNDNSTTDLLAYKKSKKAPEIYNVWVTMLKAKEGNEFCFVSKHQAYNGELEVLASKKVTLTEGEFIAETEQKS